MGIKRKVDDLQTTEDGHGCLQFYVINIMKTWLIVHFRSGTAIARLSSSQIYHTRRHRNRYSLLLMTSPR